MSKNIKFLVHGGVLAALYVVLTYAQNLLWLHHHGHSDAPV